MPALRSPIGRLLWIFNSCLFISTSLFKRLFAVLFKLIVQLFPCFSSLGIREQLDGHGEPELRLLLAPPQD